ncbi:MAG TPA: DUF1570 domain-containing protein, partial [Gemmatales bacterium]|nr:DUF1570 domain-containing protein [Gemmatales bacterium]
GGMIGGGSASGGDSGLIGGGANAPATNPDGTPKKPLWFVTAVDVTVGTQQSRPVLAHRWGTTPMRPDDAIDQFFYFQHIRFPSLNAQLETVMREKRKSEPFEVLDWMLQHWNLPAGERSGFDMQARFETLLDELARDANLSGADKERLDALLRTRDQLKNPLQPAADELAQLKKLPVIGDNYRTMTKNHYLLLYTSRRDKLAERIIARLEQVFNGYYYTMAMQGRPLPMPERQLVAVLAETEDKFNQLHKVFDSLPLHSDGFYAPLENVIILSAERRDEHFKKLVAHAADIEKELRNDNLTFEKLLRNEAIPKAVQDKSAGVIAYGRVLALALQSAREEGEICTLTREAVLQVAFASGRLPHKLHVPESVAQGLTAFFSTPRSSTELNLPSLWSGIGGPHWTLLPVYRKLVEAEGSGGKVSWPDLLAEPIVLEKSSVMQIITDEHFRDAERASEDRRAFLKVRAQAEAWALTYFLMRKRPDQYRRFGEELATLPRDMELTPQMIAQAFARAFDLIGDPESGEIAQGKVDDLEREFRSFMSYQVLAVETADKGPPPPKS